MSQGLHVATNKQQITMLPIVCSTPEKRHTLHALFSLTNMTNKMRLWRSEIVRLFMHGNTYHPHGLLVRDDPPDPFATPEVGHPDVAVPKSEAEYALGKDTYI